MSQNWVVFDYGEVISRRTSMLPELAGLMGVELAEFEPHYWSLRDAYDRGGSDEDYWQSIAGALGVGLDDSTLDTLTAVDVLGWSHTEPESMELLGALSEAGVSLALLSNAPVSFARFAERQDWARHFQVRVFSGDVGTAKPDKEIFQTLLEKLDAKPEDCLFFDDRQSNVDGAIAAGLRAHRWLGVEQAREVL